MHKSSLLQDDLSFALPGAIPFAKSFGMGKGY